MVTGHGHDGDSRRMETDEGVEDDAVGIVCNRALIVDITRDENAIDRFGCGDLHDLRKGGVELVDARATPDRSPDVPVSSVKEAH